MPTLRARDRDAGSSIPEDHSSFTEQGGPWPPHCVEGTKGAELHPGLDTDKIGDVVQKGTDVDTDGYSGFASTDLAERLLGFGIERVIVAGLATDYCVRATALEAIEHGFEAVVVTRRDHEPSTRRR